MKRFYLFASSSIFFLFLPLLSAHAASPVINWVKTAGGSGDDVAVSTTIDSSGNVYTVGYFSGTAGFPNSSVTSLGNNDIFVTKIDSSGNLVWVKTLGGTGDDRGLGIAVDGSGNVYTTGYYDSATARFNPSFLPGQGSGTLTCTATDATSKCIFISKLDSSGNFVWSKGYIGNSGSNNSGTGIAVDGSGNVYTTGYFDAVGIFQNPGPLIILKTGTTDVFLIELDTNGNFIWANNMGGAGATAKPNSIAVDSSSNIYTTGFFTGTVDFDPGAGTSNLTSAGSNDIFISKLDSSGNFVLAKNIGGTGDDQGTGIAVDSSSNIYTTGFFTGTVDFDPGAGTSNLTSAGSNDIFVSKLDSSGAFVWADDMGGATSTSQGKSIAVDASNSKYYIAGIFDNTVDFAPGPETRNLTSAGGNDIFIEQLMIDSTPPDIAGFDPADDTIGAPTSSPLTLFFDEPVAIGTGNIVIKKTSDDSIFETIPVGSGNVTGNYTSTITITPTGTFIEGTNYYVQIDSTAFTDISGNAFAGISDTTTWNFLADNVPTVITFSPADDATGVATTSNLILTFSKVVNVGTGNITIFKSSDDSVFETIDVTSGNVTGGGTDTITIDPTGTLAETTGYYIGIDSGAFADGFGAPYGGFGDNSSWNFSTGDFINPTISAFYPADNATNIHATSNLVLTFSEPVNVGTGNITIKKASDDSTFETIDVTSGNVTGGGTDTITIDPTGTLAKGASYYVQIDPTAFTDISGNPYAGISDTTTWNFTTKAAFSGTQTLYGIDGSEVNPSAPHLFTIDPATGDKLLDVGPVGFNITGMAFNPSDSKLYGVTNSSDPTGGQTDSLFEINRSTGAATLLGVILDNGPSPKDFSDISFKSDGTLYGFDDNDGLLYTIDIGSCNGTSDTECLATQVGNSSLSGFGNAVAFDSTDNLYFFPDGDNDYYQINPSTGDSISNQSFSNSSGSSYPLTAASFDGDDTVYISRVNFGSTPSDLITVDLATGTITSLGDNPDMQYIEAIAFLLTPSAVTHTLTYTAGAHGSITGTTSQTVNDGNSGSAVTAVADAGYHFLNWSDASTTNPRTDTNVTGDITVTANFAIDSIVVPPPAPSGGGGHTASQIATVCNVGQKFSTVTGLPCTAFVPQTICASGQSFSTVTGQPCTSFITEVPAPHIPDCVVTATLRYGSRGAQVKCLQAMLSTASDGIFGPKTKAAVIEFQKLHKLVPDGIVGPKTRAVLNNL